VLRVPLCDTAQELAEFAGGLADLLATAPPQVTLRFVGIHEMGHDAALVIHDVLRQKAPTTVLVTEAWSSLFDGSGLLWLLGDRRRIRPTAWLFFRAATSDEDDNPFLHPFDAIFVYPPLPVLPDRDHETVLRLAERYLPVRKMPGVPITTHMLAEYRLLDGQSTEGDQESSTRDGKPVRLASEARRETSKEQPGQPTRPIPEV
jgi:hypothetical protein